MGTLEGTRDYTHYPIQSPDDWYGLRVLDPYQGGLGAQLDCLRQICAGVDPNTPVIQTIFSPLAQAKNLAGPEVLSVHLRRYPEACHTGLATIAETTMRFIEAALQAGIAGIFYAVQHAQYGLLSEREFADFGRRYDLELLAAVDGLWLNMLHLHGSHVMFHQVADYPAHVLNWHDQETPPSLAEGQQQWAAAVCGGLDRWRDLVRGTPEQILARAHEAIAETGGQRFVLGTGCVTPIVAPRANLRAAREAVDLLG
jgi:uroporphyrinogen decarboxylase